MAPGIGDRAGSEPGVDAARETRDDAGMDYDAEVTQLEHVWRAHVTEAPPAQLARSREREPDVEVRLSVPTPASQRVLIAACARYKLRLYRLPRQRDSSMCVQVPAGFMREVLQPLLQGMAQIVEDAAHRTTMRIIDGWARRGAGDSI